MASRIQGITVEIGGDTTKLSSALSGINKEIKGTQTQLKDVEKLLKLDPSNTELVAQKQKLLAQEIGATKEKGYTLIPLNLYFKKGRVKVTVALATGKKLYDKRQAIAEKEAKRDIERRMKNKEY